MTKRFTVEKFTELEYGITKDGETLIGLSFDKITAKYIVEQWNGLAEENEQLKTIIDQLRTDNTKQKKKLNTAMKENEQLQQQNADWETAFHNCKHYKEAYGTEIVKIKQTIKDMIENERTELGQSVLRQLYEAIQ